MRKPKYLFRIFPSLLLLLLLPSGYSREENEGTAENLIFNQIKNHFELLKNNRRRSNLEDGPRMEGELRGLPPTLSIMPSSGSLIKEDATTSLNQNLRKGSKAVIIHHKIAGARLIQDASLKKFYESLATLDNHQADLDISPYSPDIFTDTDEIVTLSKINSGYQSNLSAASPGDSATPKFPSGPLEKQPGVAEWIKSSLYNLSLPEQLSKLSATYLPNLGEPPFGKVNFRKQESVEDSKNTDTINILITENTRNFPNDKPDAIVLNTTNSSIDDIHRLQQTVNSAVSAALNENEVFQDALAQIIAVPGKTSISVINSTIPDLVGLEATLKKLLGSEIIFRENQNKSSVSGVIPSVHGDSIIRNFLNKTVGVDNLNLNLSTGRINIVNIFIINIHQNKNNLHNPKNLSTSNKYHSSDESHFIPIYGNNPEVESLTGSTYLNNAPEKAPMHSDLTDGADDYNSQQHYNIPIYSNSNYNPENVVTFNSGPFFSNYEGIPTHEDKFITYDGTFDTPNELQSFNAQSEKGHFPVMPNEQNIEVDETMQENLDTLHHILAKLQSLSTSSQYPLPNDMEFSEASSVHHSNIKKKDSNNHLSNTKGLNLNKNTVLDLLPSFVRATTIAPIIPLNNASMYENIGRKPSVLGLLPNQLFAITNPKFHLLDNSTSGGIIRKDLMKSKTDSISNDNFSGRFSGSFLEGNKRPLPNFNSQFGSITKSNTENFDLKNDSFRKESPFSKFFNPPPKFSSSLINEGDDRPPSLSPTLNDVHPIKLLELLTVLSNNMVRNERLRQKTNAKELPVPSAEDKPKTLERFLKGINMESIKRAIAIGAIPSGLAFASALFPYWSPLVFGKKRRKRDTSSFAEEKALYNFYPHYKFQNSIKEMTKTSRRNKDGQNAHPELTSEHSPSPNSALIEDGNSVQKGRKIPGSNLDREILMIFVDSLLEILHRDSNSKNGFPKDNLANEFSKTDYLNNHDIDNELSTFDDSSSSSSSVPFYSLESATENEIHQPD